MTMNEKRLTLRKVDQSLTRRSLEIWTRLVSKVSLDHGDLEPAGRIFQILDQGPLTKSSVLRLVDLADSMAAQLYASPWKHFRANQISLLIRKYPFPKDINPFDPEYTAKRTFMKAEHKCSRQNRKFALRRIRKNKVHQFEYELQKARDFITYVIGNEPNLARIWDKCDVGSGASLGVHGNATNVGRKINAIWTVTPGARSFAYAACMRNQALREEIFKVPLGFSSRGADYGAFAGPFSAKVREVTYNKISFVQKTAKTHRAIAVEPLLNGFVQKGIDQELRNFLKRVGLDLSDQSANSIMARTGSIDAKEENPFCTIDLSSASDTIATEVVRELLPPDWFDFLNANRSKQYLLDGVVRPYHKFVSMGNGFCFPLETLIFASLCHAAGAGSSGRDYRVYGDDIVIRKNCYSRLTDLLRYCGFSVNKEKSFSEGPFRESCGGDWFDGVDVRPYTLDFALDSVQSYFKVLNGFQRNPLTSEFFKGSRIVLLETLPSQYHFLRPYKGPEDTGIDAIGDEYLTCPHVRFNRRLCAWSWSELISYAVDDNLSQWYKENSSSAVVYASLRSKRSDGMFTLRKQSKTKVRRMSHGGATSGWLPPY